MMPGTNPTPNAQRQHDAQLRAKELSGFMEPLRADGKSLREIAAALTAGGIPTANGGAWGPKQVRDILHRLEQSAPMLESRDPLAASHLPGHAAPALEGDPLAVLPVPADPVAL